jgi:hypothetical protein
MSRLRLGAIVMRYPTFIAAVVGVCLLASGAVASAEDDAVLNGVYRLYFGAATGDSVGKPVQTANYWYDFTTDCSGPGGCFADGTQVNTDDRSGQRGFDHTVHLSFVNGQWLRGQQYDVVCPDGSITRWMTEWTLTPEADGSLTGTRVTNPAGSNCFGAAGSSQSITATRV